MNPEIIKKGTDEYKALEMVARMLEIMSPNNAKYVVEDVYFDYGQDWMWTTICRRGYRECQVLNPREWGDILMADGIVELAKVIEDIRADKFFGDK